jgi:hypothetical protein
MSVGASLCQSTAASGFTVEQYEREVTKWEQMMQSVVKKSG